MTDDWLAQLEQLHNEDKTKRQAAAQAEAAQQKQSEVQKNQAQELLRQGKAYELMRQVQKALLGGKGLLKVHEADKKYDRIIILRWQGPISEARNPDPNLKEDIYHILVGVRDEELWVNGKKVAETTPDALKVALLEASQNPGRQKRGQTKK